MFRLVFLIIFIFFGYNKTHSQLNQQSKKITKTFFEDFTDLQDNTPALKKKKGFTNQKELNLFIEELKKLNRVEKNKKIYKILSKELKENIHSIQILIN